MLDVSLANFLAVLFALLSCQSEQIIRIWYNSNLTCIVSGKNSGGKNDGNNLALSKTQKIICNSSQAIINADLTSNCGFFLPFSLFPPRFAIIIPPLPKSIFLVKHMSQWAEIIMDAFWGAFYVYVCFLSFEICVRNHASCNLIRLDGNLVAKSTYWVKTNKYWRDSVKIIAKPWPIYLP